MATYLDRILDSHRTAAAEDIRSTDKLIEACAELAPTRGFRNALVGGDRLAVIAEIKRRSPSKGDLRIDLDPTELAQTYRDGGADAISVLTDVEYFGGSPDDLARARAAVGLPVIRKDFTVSLNDVCDTRLMGADCVLLIVAALHDDELRDLSALAVELGLDVLVETHDEAEVDRAVALTRADLIGVNQRDLVTFQVDQARAVRVAKVIPPDAVKVAESGVRGTADAEALAAAGYEAVLVGEYLVTADDPMNALDNLRVPRRVDM